MKLTKKLLDLPTIPLRNLLPTGKKDSKEQNCKHWFGKKKTKNKKHMFVAVQVVIHSIKQLQLPRREICQYLAK